MIDGAKTRASHHSSPLRYPGGKAKLASYFKAIVRKNDLLDGTYVEPFAGGAGVGLTLLLHGYVNRIVLNDLSAPIYAFWHALLKNGDRFCDQIAKVGLSVEEWERQRHIFREVNDASSFDLGFAAFYLNRTNHSGVMNGGMVGGYAQSSRYNLDARFNRDELVARVRRVMRYRDRIAVHQLDAQSLLTNLSEVAGVSDPLVYIDPPYYRKGRDLYYNFYRPSDHSGLRDAVIALGKDVRWVVSYDNEPDIVSLYNGQASIFYDLNYSVRNGKSGREVMFFSNNLQAPLLHEGGLADVDKGQCQGDIFAYNSCQPCE